MVATISHCDVFIPQSNHLNFSQLHLLPKHRRFLPLSHNTNYASISCNSWCANLNCTSQNQSIHNFSIKCSFTQNKDITNESSVDDLIKELTSKGFYDDAVKLYISMLDEASFPNFFHSFPILLKAVSGLCDFKLTSQIHGHLLKLDVIKYISVANSLLSTFWKCGAHDYAIWMFKTMQEKDSVSWSTMINGFQQSRLYIKSLEWFTCMVCKFGILPNRVACISALSSCASIKSLMHGKELHTFFIKCGLDTDEFFLSGLLEFYMKCGFLRYAKQLFQSVVADARENYVLWNVMILGYVENNCYSQALFSFIEMMILGVKPDSSTMVAVLVLCSESLNLALGQQIHALIVKFGLDIDVRVRTSLIDMYFNCVLPDCGLKLFNGFHIHNLVMWGTIVTNCARFGYSRKALDLFVAGLNHGYVDSVILLAAFRACSSLELEAEGRLVHGITVKLGLDLDTFICSALIDMYMKCRDISSAKTAFSRLPMKDEVSWSCLISGYAHNESWDDAVSAFSEMQSRQIRPNAVIISCLLSICARVYSNLQCKEIHGYMIRNGFDTNTLVNNSLVASYAKCGNMKSSRTVFSRMEEKDAVSWNSMMLGLGLHGHVDELLDLFDKMKKIGLRPDRQTFTAILFACSHTGRIAEGLKYFRSMTEEYMLEPELEQYTCLVDLLGRAGYVDKAYDLITTMPHTPDDRIWGSLLGSCRIHGDESLAEVVANHIFELNPDSIGYRVLLANLYQDSKKWIDSMEHRAKIQDMGLKKSPGCSWIDVNNQIHVFTASDRTHHQVELIYVTLKFLTTEMLENGYIPQL
ncbi:unnamed protein product [Amaranthus hypochondriacus]